MNRVRTILCKFKNPMIFETINVIKRNKRQHQIQYLLTLFNIPFLEYNKHKNSKATIDEIIQKTDDLFTKEQYVEVYEMLLKYKDEQNIDINWRLGRVLLKLVRSGQFDEHTNRLMIMDAYNIISKCLEIDENNADVHKWMAIILIEKLKTEGSYMRIAENIRVKDHLLKSHELNPTDYAVLFLLGKWYHNMSKLTWLQQQISKLFFNNLTFSEKEEALSYFLKAEKIQPRYCVSNMFMLGTINYEMGNMYRAHYYLRTACQLEPVNEAEMELINTARFLVDQLKNYDVSEEAL